MMHELSHRRPLSFDAQQQETQLFWQQCQRQYTFQPIYQVTGRLMAIELLTAVSHPDSPHKRLSPEAYFAALTIPQRLTVVREQLVQLSLWHNHFIQSGLVASVNIDGPTLLAIQHEVEIRALIARLPWVRFELVEHYVLPHEPMLANMPELQALWLDDFGSGMANFSALTELKYDFIKLSRDLLILLRQSDEGQALFNMLLALINRYCNGVIVEGVETEEEWMMVRHSPAFAAQGYFFSRPVAFDRLQGMPLQLP